MISTETPHTQDSSSSEGRANRLSLGARGERIAQHYLHCQGFCTEASNWRHGRLGEVDLIMAHTDKKLLIFVEVKTRKGEACGTPAEAVGLAKQGKLRQLAEIYLAQDTFSITYRGWDVRFDIIGVNFVNKNPTASIEHIENAF